MQKILVSCSLRAKPELLFIPLGSSGPVEVFACAASCCSASFTVLLFTLHLQQLTMKEHATEGLSRLEEVQRLLLGKQGGVDRSCWCC